MGTSLWSWTAEAVAAWAQLATLLLGCVAAIAGFYQLRIHKMIGREAEAQESFREYLRFLIEHKGVDQRSADNQQQYHYLVVFMLTTFEKIYQLSRADQSWLVTMRGHILYHREYLDELNLPGRNFFETFDPDFSAFIISTLSDANTTNAHHVADAREAVAVAAGS